MIEQMTKDLGCHQIICLARMVGRLLGLYCGTDVRLASTPVVEIV